MATTMTMDDHAFASLPDRRRLAGAPLIDQVYRDSGDSEFVYRWDPNITVGTVAPRQGGWIHLRRLRP